MLSSQEKAVLEIEQAMGSRRSRGHSKKDFAEAGPNAVLHHSQAFFGSYSLLAFAVVLLVLAALRFEHVW